MIESRKAAGTFFSLLGSIHHATGVTHSEDHHKPQTERESSYQVPSATPEASGVCISRIISTKGRQK